MQQLNRDHQQQQQQQEQQAGQGRNKRRHSSRFGPASQVAASQVAPSRMGAAGDSGCLTDTPSCTTPGQQAHASASQAAGAPLADAHTQLLQLSHLAIALALEAGRELQQLSGASSSSNSSTAAAVLLGSSGAAAGGSAVAGAAGGHSSDNPAHLNSSCVDRGVCLQAALALLRLAKLSRQDVAAHTNSAGDIQLQQQQQHIQLSAACVSGAAELLQHWWQLQVGASSASQQGPAASSSSNSSSSLHATLSAAALEMQQLLHPSSQPLAAAATSRKTAGNSSSSSGGVGSGGEASRRRSQGGSSSAVAASGAALVAGLDHRDVLRVLRSQQGTGTWAALCRVVGQEPLLGLLLVTCCSVRGCEDGVGHSCVYRGWAACCPPPAQEGPVLATTAGRALEILCRELCALVYTSVHSGQCQCKGASDASWLSYNQLTLMSASQQRTRLARSMLPCTESPV
jgi:hypothetical protein